MLKTTKVNALFLIGVSVLYIFIVTSECNAKPLDIYDEFIGNDEKQLLLQMAELIDSIGADDSDSDSGRYNGDDAASSIGNDLKLMKPGERCILPMRKGVCRALIPRWSYDPITRECREFVITDFIEFVFVIYYFKFFASFYPFILEIRRL